VKIAYLVSRYPAVSHTFILQEVEALRAIGVEIGTFSIRKAQPNDILGPAAQREARQTRHLVPASIPSYLRAAIWACCTRPILFLTTLWYAIGRYDISVRERLMWFFYFSEAIQLAHWLVRERFNHLHCHLGNNGSNTALLAARLARLPFSLTLHGMDMEQPERFRLADKAAAADFIICISEYGRGYVMRKTAPEHWSRLHVIHCGLDFSAFPPLPPPYTGANRLLCVARLSPEKGHRVLLAALAMLHHENIEFNCSMVGDGPLRAALENEVRSLGLESKVTFHGALSPAEALALYPTHDITVLASFIEGIPMVLMESLAHARPVVATQVGGIVELVHPPDNGMLVPPGNPHELARALRHLLTHPDEARRMGRSGYDYVRAHFRTDIQAQRIKNLFTASANARRRFPLRLQADDE
jgi:glycosyltransferase involved in cell wall biosynthesis